MALGKDDVAALANATPRWTVREREIAREFTFPDFPAAIAFVNRIAELAQQMNHHPDIYISYNTVRLVLRTHKVDGLTRNDFILAEKIDTVA